MSRKGFTLVELLACLVLLGVILGIGLYVTRDTLSTSLSTLTDVSKNQIYDAAKIYVIEKGTDWVNTDGTEYTCVIVEELVDLGYFQADEVSVYEDIFVKIVREPKTKVVNSVTLVEICE